MLWEIKSPHESISPEQKQKKGNKPSSLFILNKLHNNHFQPGQTYLYVYYWIRVGFIPTNRYYYLWFMRPASCPQAADISTPLDFLKVTAGARGYR
jgi:hypothetical protein